MTGSVGFIGVGTIAGVVARRLRAIWPELDIHLSPRSEARSKALAAEHPRNHRHGSNSAVVDASAVVMLTMLPAQFDDAVRDLRFREGQIVVSCVAGTPIEQLCALAAPARACRFVPLPMMARGEGPALLYPALAEIRDLFAGSADLVEPADEATFLAYVAAGATMSSIVALQGATAEWIVRRGAAPGDAAAYMASLFRGVAGTVLATLEAELPELVGEHETRGGLNERVRTHLQARGWFDAPGAAFDHIAALSRHQLKREG